MKRKLDVIRSKKVADFPVLEIKQVEQVEAIKSVRESVDQLFSLLNDKQDYDFDLLKSQLEVLAEKLDFQPILSSLEKLNSKESPSILTIKDFSRLLEAVEKNKPVPVDLSRLEKAIIQVQQTIQDQTVQPDQAPDTFQPVRRVIKVGNRLIFDDQPTPSRGGGGSSSSGSSTTGLTNEQLRASPVPVSATIDTTGLATTATDNNTAAIKAAILPEGTDTIPISPISTAMMGGVFDDGTTGSIALSDNAEAKTIEANSAAIKTSLELLDNAIAGNELQVDVLTMPTTTVTGSGTFTTKEVRSATPTQTSVNDTASSTTLIASNANRLGATIFNDSTVALYVKLGATASTTSFSIKLDAGDYYEIPFGYTGVVDGIWASDASGAARITELTA